MRETLYFFIIGQVFGLPLTTERSILLHLERDTDTTTTPEHGLSAIKSALPESTWTADRVKEELNEIRLPIQVPLWFHETIRLNWYSTERLTEILVATSPHASQIYTDTEQVAFIAGMWVHFCIKPLLRERTACYEDEIVSETGREMDGWVLSSAQVRNYLNHRIAHESALTSGLDVNRSALSRILTNATSRVSSVSQSPVTRASDSTSPITPLKRIRPVHIQPDEDWNQPWTTERMILLHFERQTGTTTTPFQGMAAIRSVIPGTEWTEERVKRELDEIRLPIQVPLWFHETLYTHRSRRNTLIKTLVKTSPNASAIYTDESRVANIVHVWLQYCLQALVHNRDACYEDDIVSETGYGMIGWVLSSAQVERYLDDLIEKERHVISQLREESDLLALDAFLLDSDELLISLYQQPQEW